MCDDHERSQEPKRERSWEKNCGTKWLHRLGLKGWPGPGQPTIHCIFKGIDAGQVERAITAWAEEVLRRFGVSEEEWVGSAVAGKSLRAAHRTTAAEDRLVSLLEDHLVSLWTAGKANKSESAAR